MKLRNKIFLSCMLLILSQQINAACPKNSETNYKEILNRATDNALPGAMFYYQKKDCVINLASGYSNLSLKTKLRKNDRFPIASISKLFTSITSIKLAKSGLFNLDDTITKWLPTTITDRIPNSNSITIRHLLSHTSGIFDYINDGPAYWNYIFSLTDTNVILTELDILKYVYDKPLFFLPGTKYQYSNTNYVLMGLIIKQATNQDFSANIRELILIPLQLNDTFHISEVNQQLDFTHVYLEADKVLFDIKEIIKIAAFADGGIVSSTRDLSTFIQAIILNKNFMNNELLATLLSSPVANSTAGLGISLTTNKNTGASYGFIGSYLGYSTAVSFSPDSNETSIYFINGKGGDIMSLYSSAFLNEIGREKFRSTVTFTVAP